MDANNSAISDGDLRAEIEKLESSARQYQQEVSCSLTWPYRLLSYPFAFQPCGQDLSHGMLSVSY